MSLKIANVVVIVRGEISNRIVDFSAGIDNALRVMCESCQMASIFLRGKMSQMCSFAR